MRRPLQQREMLWRFLYRVLWAETASLRSLSVEVAAPACKLHDPSLGNGFFRWSDARVVKEVPACLSPAARRIRTFPFAPTTRHSPLGVRRRRAVAPKASGRATERLILLPLAPAQTGAPLAYSSIASS